MIVYRQGNILDAPEGIICQQVNHQGVMGSGLAWQIRNKYPDIFEDYAHICKITIWDQFLNEKILHLSQVSPTRMIANIFGQDNYGSDGAQYTDYDALYNGLAQVRIEARIKNLSVAIPYKMGCGLGGGDWEVVSGIINDIWLEEDVYVYKYRKGFMDYDEESS